MKLSLGIYNFQVIPSRTVSRMELGGDIPNQDFPGQIIHNVSIKISWRFVKDKHIYKLIGIN